MIFAGGRWWGQIGENLRVEFQSAARRWKCGPGVLVPVIKYITRTNKHLTRIGFYLIILVCIMRDLIAVSLDVVDISFSFVHHFSASAGRNLLMCWLEQPGCLIIQLITHETPVTQPCHAATSNTNCSGTWHYTYYLIPNKYAVLNMYAKVQLCYSFLPSQMHFIFLFSALCHLLTLAHTVIHKDRQCNSQTRNRK